jgi:hypothetical protein
MTEAAQTVVAYGFELDGVPHAGETHYDGKAFDLQMFCLTCERFNLLCRK